jgi:hypothetical protein
MLLGKLMELVASNKRCWIYFSIALATWLAVLGAAVNSVVGGGVNVNDDDRLQGDKDLDGEAIFSRIKYDGIKVTKYKSEKYKINQTK